MLYSTCNTSLGGTLPAHGVWEPLHGGQGSISQEYQTYTSAHLFDTLGAGLGWGTSLKGLSTETTSNNFLAFNFIVMKKVLILRVKIVPWGLLAISMSCETCHLFSSTKEKEFIIAAAYEINQKLPVKSCKQLANCVSLHNLWRLFGAIYVPIQNRVLPSQFVIFYSYYLCTSAGRG